MNFCIFGLIPVAQKGRGRMRILSLLGLSRLLRRDRSDMAAFSINKLIPTAQEEGKVCLTGGLNRTSV